MTRDVFQLTGNFLSLELYQLRQGLKANFKRTSVNIMEGKQAVVFLLAVFLQLAIGEKLMAVCWVLDNVILSIRYFGGLCFRV